MLNINLILISIAHFIFFLGLFHVVLAALQALSVFFTVRKEFQHSELLQHLVAENPDLLLSVSIIIPAYNEEITLPGNILNLLSLNYPHYDIIVVNDGSKDGTLTSLISDFQLTPKPYYYEQIAPHQPIHTIYNSEQHSNLWVIDKQNGGKADAINAGINLSRSDLFCVIDADSILEANALKKVIRPFIEFPDTAISVGGVISGINNLDIRSGRVHETSISSSIIHNIQSIEYYRSFFIARNFWNLLDSNFIVSGAFGLFKKEAVIEVGGFSLNTVGEDLELIFKLRSQLKGSQNNAVFFVSDPVCWTETPGTLKGLKSQRKRWQQGMLETLFKYKHLLFNKKDIVFGWIILPYLWLTETIFVPATLIGYGLFVFLYLKQAISIEFLIAFFVLEVLLGITISLLSILIKQWQDPQPKFLIDTLVYFLTAIIEVFGYRQLNAIWRIQGYWQFLRGNKGWGTIKRQGL